MFNKKKKKTLFKSQSTKKAEKYEQITPQFHIKKSGKERNESQLQT
jgi:hypothetical protein